MDASTRSQIRPSSAKIQPPFTCSEKRGVKRTFSVAHLFAERVASGQLEDAKEVATRPISSRSFRVKAQSALLRETLMMIRKLVGEKSALEELATERAKWGSEPERDLNLCLAFAIHLSTDLSGLVSMEALEKQLSEHIQERLKTISLDDEPRAPLRYSMRYKRLLACFLLPPNGKINAGYMQWLREQAKPDVATADIAAFWRCTEAIATDARLADLFASIQAPAEGGTAAAVAIRLRLGLPELKDPNNHEARLAVLSELGEHYQTQAGSCFATYFVRELLEHRLADLLCDLKEFIEHGFLTRLVDGRPQYFPALMRIGARTNLALSIEDRAKEQGPMLTFLENALAGMPDRDEGSIFWGAAQRYLLDLVGPHHPHRQEVERAIALLKTKTVYLWDPTAPTAGQAPASIDGHTRWGAMVLCDARRRPASWSPLTLAEVNTMLLSSLPTQLATFLRPHLSKKNWISLIEGNSCEQLHKVYEEGAVATRFTCNSSTVARLFREANGCLMAAGATRLSLALEGKHCCLLDLGEKNFEQKHTEAIIASNALVDVGYVMTALSKRIPSIWTRCSSLLSGLRPAPLWMVAKDVFDCLAARPVPGEIMNAMRFDEILHEHLPGMKRHVAQIASSNWVHENGHPIALVFAYSMVTRTWEFAQQAEGHFARLDTADWLSRRWFVSIKGTG